MSLAQPVSGRSGGARESPRRQRPASSLAPPTAPAPPSRRRRRTPTTCSRHRPRVDLRRTSANTRSGRRRRATRPSPAAARRAASRKPRVPRRHRAAGFLGRGGAPEPRPGTPGPTGRRYLAACADRPRTATGRPREARPHAWLRRPSAAANWCRPARSRPGRGWRRVLFTSDLRADQPRPVTRRTPPGRAGGQGPIAAARPLQDRRARQGRHRQDHLAAASDRSSPSCARKTAWWPSTPIPRSASCGSRIDPSAAGSYWELAADQHLNSFADMRSRVGNNPPGCSCWPVKPPTARRRVLDAGDLPGGHRHGWTTTSRISIIDCGSTMDSAVTQEVLSDLDALIVVSSPWFDGASAAGQTLEWLANNGYTGLLHRTVVVLNDSDGHADTRRTRTLLVEQFGSRGQTVIEVPYDAHLRPGGVIDIDNEIDRVTRRRIWRSPRRSPSTSRPPPTAAAEAPMTTTASADMPPPRPSTPPKHRWCRRRAGCRSWSATRIRSTWCCPRRCRCPRWSSRRATRSTGSCARAATTSCRAARMCSPAWPA